MKKPLSSSAIQINLFGNEGLATTIRNRFVSSDISSIRPPEFSFGEGYRGIQQVAFGRRAWIDTR